MILTTDPAQACAPGWVETHRGELGQRDKDDVLAAYGFALDVRVAEWDHLVAIELGGDAGRLNTWPQLDPAQADRKDRLEGRLRTAVCTGTMTMVQAQIRITNFWLWW